jgi:hypothetical protein
MGRDNGAKSAKKCERLSRALLKENAPYYIEQNKSLTAQAVVR